VFISFPLAYFDVLLSLYRDNLWIVHPKNENVVIICSPTYVAPNLHEFLSSVEHKNNFKECC